MQDGDQEVIGITEQLVSEQPVSSFDEPTVDGAHVVRSFETEKAQVVDEVCRIEHVIPVYFESVHFGGVTT